MRSRDAHRPRRPTPLSRGRIRCRPRVDGDLALALMNARELYVGTLAGEQPSLWRVALDGERRCALGAAPAGDSPRAVREWAARQLLAAALRYDASVEAVRALADELPQLAGSEVELSDLEVRLWFLAWRLQHRAAG